MAISLLLLAALPAAADTPAPELVARARPSVVTLQTETVLGEPAGNGTGFLISADGLVVTNHHVVAAGPSVALMADGTRRAVLGLLATDEAADVAILRIEGEGHPALPLATARPAVGDRVVVIGSPLGLEQTVTEGEISALRPTGLPPEAQESEVAKASLLQITAEIAPGSSGSPVLDASGAVIGVAQSASPVWQQHFAVDIEEVRELQAGVAPGAALTPIDSPVRQLALTLGLVGGLVALATAPGIFRWARERARNWSRRRRRGGKVDRPPTWLPPPP